jgi:hypothetical protein
VRSWRAAGVRRKGAMATDSHCSRPYSEMYSRILPCMWGRWSPSERPNVGNCLGDLQLGQWRGDRDVGVAAVVGVPLD